MSARPVLAERRVRLSASETVVVRLEQAKRGALVVGLHLEVQRADFRGVSGGFELGPQDVRRVAQALEAIAGEQEGRA